MYSRSYADKHGRIVRVERRAINFPVHCDQDCDPSVHYINSAGARCEKTELAIVSQPKIIGGVVEIPLGESVIFFRVPAGTHISHGAAPVAEFDAPEDFSFSVDMPGAIELTFDAPEHLPKSIIVRVLPAVAQQ